MIIHPANCYEGDAVWFLHNDFSVGGKIERGEKAVFLSWEDDYASARVKLSSGEICCTNSDILEIKEND